MILNIDPKNDYIFKKVFGSAENHALLMNLLQAVLMQYLTSPIKSVEILNPFNEKDGLNDKLSVLDIKVRDQAGRQFNVEMQLFPHRSYPERALYYWARLYHQQLHEGEDYSKLKTTFVISFVDFILFPKVADYHLDFQLLSKKHPELVFSSQLNLHLIELPKFRLAVDEVSTPLEQWCYFLRHGMNFETTALPETMKVPEIKKAVEILTVLSQTDIERERYEARIKGQRDYNSIMASARLDGLEEGVEKGMEKGEKKATIPPIRFLQAALKIPVAEVEELMLQPLADLESLQETLQQQLLAAMSTK